MASPGRSRQGARGPLRLHASRAENLRHSQFIHLAGYKIFDQLGIFLYISQIKEYAVKLGKYYTCVKCGSLVALHEAMVFGDSRDEPDAKIDYVATVLIKVQVLRPAASALKGILAEDRMILASLCDYLDIEPNNIVNGKPYNLGVAILRDKRSPQENALSIARQEPSYTQL